MDERVMRVMYAVMSRPRVSAGKKQVAEILHRVRKISDPDNGKDRKLDAEDKYQQDAEIKGRNR